MFMLAASAETLWFEKVADPCLKMSISVVIPTFNRAGLVCKAIDSVLAQSHPATEIVVVDDGSTDNTKDRVKVYGDRIRYIWRENGGLSRARNTGIEAARGPWIAFLDDDDEFLHDKLAIHAQSAARYPGVDVHAANTILVSETGEQTNLWQLRGAPVALDQPRLLFHAVRDVSQTGPGRCGNVRSFHDL
jgi:glycosyltransferase involved in cell wall biosynthesis